MISPFGQVMIDKEATENTEGHREVKVLSIFAGFEGAAVKLKGHGVQKGVMSFSVELCVLCG